MLLAVAPNPSLDRILTVPHMTVGEVHRATGVRLVPAGKGLNVARAARILGCQVLTTGPLGGRSGQMVADLAQEEGFAADWYRLNAGDTRTCLLINHDDRDTTVINEPGPAVSSKDWEEFVTHLKHLGQQVKAIAFAGSLPPGIPPEDFAAVARLLAGGGRTVYVDTSAKALTAMLAGPKGLSIKVNLQELATGFGISVQDQSIGRTVEMGQKLLDRGAAMVAITLGSEGALAITPDGAWQATPPPVDIISTVGSGDSLLAGLAVAQLEGQPIDAALAFGVACGSANAQSSTPGKFEREEVEQLLAQVDVTRISEQ